MNNRIPSYTFFPLILVISVTCIIVSYLAPYKIWQLEFLTLPGGVVLFPLAYIFDDIIAEVYGYAYARQAIWLKLLSLTLLAAAVTLIAALPAAPGHIQTAITFSAVFSHGIKTFLGYAIGLLVSDFANTMLISKWKIKTKGKYFSLRTIGSAAVGEAMFSIVCGFIVYIGVISFTDYVKITLSVWSIKMIYGIIIAYPASLIVAKLKQYENLDPYDTHTNFNPFQLSTAPTRLNITQPENVD